MDLAQLPDKPEDTHYKVHPEADAFHASNRNWFVAHWILGVVFLLALAGAVVAGIYYWQTVRQIPASVAVPVHVEKVDPYAGWNAYTSTQYAFEFKYPPTWAKVIDTKASLSDYLSADGARTFVAIFPITYPAQDHSARVDVYPVSLETAKTDNPFLKGKLSSSVTVNNISWSQIQNTDSSGNPIDSFEYLTEKDGKTYDVGGPDVLTKQILSAFKFTDSITRSSALLNIFAHGGLCVTGTECSSNILINSDGKVYFAGALKLTLSSTELSNLVKEINSTDFKAVQSVKFTGTCPIAFDGQEFEYTFYASSGTFKIDSCKVQIDPNSALFKQINNITVRVI